MWRVRCWQLVHGLLMVLAVVAFGAFVLGLTSLGGAQEFDDLGFTWKVFLSGVGGLVAVFVLYPWVATRLDRAEVRHV